MSIPNNETGRVTLGLTLLRVPAALRAPAAGYLKR